ncbi:DUF3995 domain-containing protein [Streptacidiphilus sp. MAP12-16]|uniref:DUF3995 domain-containing protein n=1 Tax=Streptacidiphilus sp. MAP12-16 TaxID=3156300 RepID=UPI0035144901
MRAGYAACVWGLVFALISFYWGCGGTLGLDTVGGTIEQQARAHEVGILVVVWIVGLLKVVGAALALALVRPQRVRPPARLLVFAGGFAAALLTLYGAYGVTGGALVAAGVIKPTTPVAWKPLWWHLWVWDMSFLLWGLMFAGAVWYFARRGRRPAL